MNAGMKDMLNVMDKLLALDMPLPSVVLWSTWNPAKEIKHEELGNLSVGSPADIAVLRVENGKFGFVDMNNARLDKLPSDYKQQGDPRWDSFAPRAPSR
jgi:dihydroorotase